jgi:hypothetical protein
VFPLRALAALAGRLPLGGDREVVMALLLSARLALGCTAGAGLDGTLRKARAVGARHWCGAMTLPAAVRAAVLQVADATGQDSREAVAAALDRVIALAAAILDGNARSELRQLLVSLRAS